MSIDDGAVESAELLRLHADAQVLVDRALFGAVDFGRNTPCAGWRLRDLLAHMLGQNRGLREALGGGDGSGGTGAAGGGGDGGRDVASWRPVDPGVDPAASLASSERALVATFAVRGLDGVVWMPELSPNAPIPARIALLAHLIDTVVHGWDVAASLGRPYRVPEDVLDVAVSVTGRIPAAQGRGQTGSAFAAPVVHQGVSPLDSMLSYLGRDPRAWPTDPA